jgi:hypothetical protein
MSGPLYFAANFRVVAGEVDAALQDYIREANRLKARTAKTRALSTAEASLAKALRAAFAAQRKSFLAHLVTLGAGFTSSEAARAATDRIQVRLREAVTRWDIPFNDAATATLSLFTDPVQAGLEAAYLAGGTWETMSLDIDRDFTLEDPRAVKWLDGRAAERVANINETTRGKLERIITDGLASGDSYNKIAASIRSTYDGWETGARPGIPSFIQDRAELIATTELGFGYEAGSRSVVDDLSAQGLEMEQSFLTAGSPCPECGENEDAGWIPLSEEFPNGPAPVHPGCRCTALYQRAEEAA